MSERGGVSDTIPPARREEKLRADGYRCRTCPAKSVEVGGAATVEVHHRDPDPVPEECDRHAVENLTTLCDDCHSWLHKKPTGEGLPIAFSDADRRALKPVDYLILQVLCESGPCEMRTIQDRMALMLSPTAVRERVWRLMGLDYEVTTRERPVVDQDAVTGEWGLVDQISESERGRIPDDPRALLQRVHDERVRRALARGCDRETVMEAFDIARRTTWYKQYRAQAYDFPLEEFEGRSSRGAGSSGEDVGPSAASIESEGAGELSTGEVQSECGDSEEVWS